MNLNIQMLNEPVASNIVRLIKDKGLKFCTVAEKSNLKPQNLTDVIKGRRLIKASEVECLANALGVEPNELFKTD